MRQWGVPMILSFLALQRWFAEPLPPAAELIERLTFAGLEGEQLISLRRQVEPLVAARVLKAESVAGTQVKRCELDLGGGRTAVVATSEASVAAGETVAYAAPGVSVAGVRVGLRTIAGVESQGMLLSRAEAGVGGDSTRVWRVELQPGESLCAAVDDDWLLDVSVTPNRGDWLSYLGVARELAVLLGRELIWPELAHLPEAAPVALALADADCAHYLGVRIDLDGPLAALPDYVEAVLGRSGMRCLHPLVDLTNYVMLELGQPMHAFDADKIQGSVRVRAAAAGEEIVTLDGVARTLSGGELVIADDAGPIALAGVMGGARTEVDAGTRRVLLESAWFAPARVTRTRRPLGLSSEASYRFERGVDRAGAERAVQRLLALLAGVAPYRVVGVGRVGAPPPPPPPVVWEPSRFVRLIGAACAPEDAQRLLTGLGFVPADGVATMLVVPSADSAAVPLKVPTWRFDVERPEDLVEEVARTLGYDTFAPTLPASPAAPPPPPPAAAWRRKLLDLAVARGFRQAIHLSFLADQAADAVPLANPLGAETRALRTALLPGLLQAVARNHAHQRYEVALVEVGKVFHAASNAVAEAWHLGLVQTGLADPCAFAGRRVVDFYDIKGHIQHLLMALGVPAAMLDWTAPDPATLPAPWHPVRTAQVHVAGTPVGLVGEIDPDSAAALDLKAVAVAAELNLEPMVAAAEAQAVPGYVPSPAAPASTKDLALVVAATLPAATLLATVRKAAGALLEDVRVFDVYRGTGVPAGHVSLALRLTLRHPERTLSHDEIEAVLQAVVAAARDAHGAELRGS